MVNYAKDNHGMSERHACKIVSMHRSTYRYPVRSVCDGSSYQSVISVSQQYDYWGYRKVADIVRGAGESIGRERVREIRRKEGLQIPRKSPPKRYFPASTREVTKAEYPGHVWSWDFQFDQTEDGKTLKFLNIVDEYSKVALANECHRSLTGTDVKRVLGKLIQTWGAPVSIRSDNGPEFVAKQITQWLEEHTIGTHYIDPGCPWQNPYIESFNSIFRTTFLNRWCFRHLAEVRVLTQQWREEYNSIRPHGSLRGLSPLQFLRNFRRDNPNFNLMKCPNP